MTRLEELDQVMEVHRQSIKLLVEDSPMYKKIDWCLDIIWEAKEEKNSILREEES